MDKITENQGIQFVPRFVKQISDMEYGSTVTHENYNAKLNLNTVQGDYNSEILRLLLTINNKDEVPHIPYLDTYINEIIDEVDAKAYTKDLSAVATSGSYTDLLDTPTKLSEFTNDTKFVNEDTLNNNLTNLSKEIITLFQNMDNRVTSVENTANSAIDSATSAQNTAISAEEKANTAINNAATANTNAAEALTLAQSYGTAIANKQDQLTAGDNISIIDNVISATDTTYIAGDNVTIVDNVISSIDTKYTAGANITIDENNVISSTGGGGSSYELPIASDTVLGGIKVGANLNITEDGTLNAEAGGGTGGTEYTAGEGIRIEDDIISSKPWFFSLSKGAEENFSYDDYPDVAEALVKIANYFLKYNEIPQVYWYNKTRLTNTKPNFSNASLYILQGMYQAGTGNKVSVTFYFRSVDTSHSISTGTYGLSCSSASNKIVYFSVPFSGTEWSAGEITTLPTGSKSTTKQSFYYLNEAGKNRILTTTNTAAYTPTGDYHPATKKYVDDAVANVGGTEYTAGENISISEDNVISAIPKTYEDVVIEENGATTYVQSDAATTMLRVLDNLENPTKWTEVNSNSIIVQDGDNKVTVTPTTDYTYLKNTAYKRTVTNRNADGTLLTIEERSSEETGPVYSLIDKDYNIAMLSPTALHIAGVDVLNRYSNLGLNTKGEIGVNSSSNEYIRTTLANGTKYQLAASPKYLSYQYYDGTNWSSKWVLQPYYETGDTETFTSNYNCIGFLSGGSTSVNFTMITPKLLDNITSASLKSFNITIRHSAGGYLLNKATEIDGTIEVQKSNSNALRVVLTFNKAFTQTNNTPVVVTLIDTTVEFR